MIPSLIPRPARIEVREGSLAITKQTSILAPAELTSEAAYLARRLRAATGFPFPINERGAGEHPFIQLSLDPALDAPGPEGYRLEAETKAVTISAGTSAGIFRGLQTLLQLLPAAVYGSGLRSEIDWRVPCIWIEDQPRFSWRGVMLDSSRHFFPVEFIRRMLDLAALHKLNIFHWHLADDQGWRLEIKKYPRLTEIGAWRSSTLVGHADRSEQQDGIAHGGFYTQDDVRGLVRYAAERHITIVPEIDIPGHSQAAIAAYPELGCVAHRLEPWTRWGINENILHPRESTFRFLEDVFAEVAELFPGPFIHVGGDEAVTTQWEGDAEVKALMERERLSDCRALETWFINRVGQFIRRSGRRMIGWDEILNDGLVEGAAVMSWRGEEPGLRAARLGRDVVMAPSTHTYLDKYQNAPSGNEPLAIGGFIPLEKVHGYEPAPGTLSAGENRRILGLQGQLWSEYLPTQARVEYMAFPRLSALAEVGWSARERGYDDFLRRLTMHLKRLDVLGVKYCHP